MIAVGTDILKLGCVDDRFVKRILTDREQQEFYASAQANRLQSKRFAAREAIAKGAGNRNRSRRQLAGYSDRSRHQWHTPGAPQ